MQNFLRLSRRIFDAALVRRVPATAWPYLRQFRSETLQMVPGRASSASILLRNAADGAWKSIICVNFTLKRCRWCRGGHYLRQFHPETLQMVPEKASSASLSPGNATDSAGNSIICVIFAQKCCRWCLKKHHLRQFCSEMLQIAPGRALSASISLRNAADGA